MLYGGVPSAYRPLENVDSRIVVAGQTQTTRAVDKTHGEIEVLEQLTAARASLGGIGRVHQHDVSSSVCSFDNTSIAQVAPARIQDTFAEVGIANHVGDLQVFQSNQIVVFGIEMGHFVEQVLTLVLDMFVQALNAQQCLAAVVAALDLALQSALSKAQIALGQAIVLRRFNALARTVGEQVLDIQIDANLLSCWGQANRIRQLATKAHVPLASRAPNACRFDTPCQRAMPTHSNSTHSRHLEASAIHLKAIAVLFEAKAIEVLKALEAWIARPFASLDAAKEGPECLVAIGSRYLVNVAVNSLEMAKGSFVALDQSKLFIQTNAAPFKLVAIFPLRKTHIVPTAGRVQAQRKALFLSRRGIEAVLISFHLHGQEFTAGELENQRLKPFEKPAYPHALMPGGLRRV